MVVRRKSPPPKEKDVYNKNPRSKTEGFLSKLIWYIRTEESIQTENDLLESCGIVFKDMNQANEYFKRFQNLTNNTRKWANCGYTPKELFATR